MIKKWQKITAQIEDISFWWCGIAKIEDFVVFFDWGIPWQKVEATICKLKKNYAEAKIQKIIEKSPDEIEPRCKYFGACWWCKLQNLSYSDQLKYKARQVSDCVDKIWKIKLPLTSITGSPKEYAYRNKVEFSFGYQSMKVVKDSAWNKTYYDEGETLGFHKPWSWEEIVSVDRCELISDKANEVYLTIKNWCLAHKQFQVYNPYTHKGFWRHLLIRETRKWDILINIIVQDTKTPSEEFINFFKELSFNINVKSFYLTINNKLNDDWSTEKPLLCFGESIIQEEILWLKFNISPASFLQTNSYSSELLYEKVIQYLPNSENLVIFDLYCGIWSIWQVVWSRIKWSKIIWIEFMQEAVKDAIANAKINNLSNTTFVAWKVEDIVSSYMREHSNPDVIILDPPRWWIHNKALTSIKFSGAKMIIYVSCNVSTFSRDLEILSSRYNLKDIQAVDMFPHTAHIEIVACLTKK